jgi:hypothetical protein
MAENRNDAEQRRLQAARDEGVSWRKWGPYLSERQWGTVREDYSNNGDAWNYFNHDQSRSRAYRWGEDGLAGFSDEKQRLCFALALWNGRDPILKERLFGLTNGEGNHGEDVKEYYFYLDATPTHSYMKWLYKYPHGAFPYKDLVATSRHRSRHDLEYELLDTGIFDEDRYWDVVTEFAKATPEDILIRITVTNRGPEPATLHVLPTLWFRNTWSWDAEQSQKPNLHEIAGCAEVSIIAATHDALGERWLYIEGGPSLLFTENETNTERLFGKPNHAPYVKDGINRCVVEGRNDTVNPERTGTKGASHHQATIGHTESATFRLRLSDGSPNMLSSPFADFDDVFETRRNEADAFYAKLIPRSVGEDRTLISRQAYAGMLWTKQYYLFDANKWLREHGSGPFIKPSRPVRNHEWSHMMNDHVISMPDKWEYPWYAAWDLAFHTIPLSAVDVDFAKEQLDLMLREAYLHPNGQIPAYEWKFSDVNPPVHALATIFIYRTEQALRGQADIGFLKRSFGKLLANFTWWVNRKDWSGKNVFEGGFLGLDNIGVFDRSSPLPTGGTLEQADSTAWMSLFCQNMLEIGIELAVSDPTYEDLVAKFLDHFLWIAYEMNREGGMWDENDGFYYDLIRLPDGSATPLKVRSAVGLLPLCATTVYEYWQRQHAPSLVEQWLDRARRMPELVKSVHPTGESNFGHSQRGIFAVVTPDKLRRILARLLDESEFLSPYGIRAMSRYHAEHPFVFHANGEEYRVAYLPAESDSGMFGGNSNWRGPIWMPINLMLYRALLQFYGYYGDSFKIECPTGSGRLMSLFEVAQELATRLVRIFTRDEQGRRAVYGGTEKFQSDPNWRDHILFYEYFNGDNGAGLGASHQTGWTGIVSTFIQFLARFDSKELLRVGRKAVHL